MRRKEDISKVQKNWRKYYKKHPNTNIYYQARKPQYREMPEPKIHNINPIYKLFSFIWRIIKKLIVLLIILYLIGYLGRELDEYNKTKEEINREWEYREK